jgi:hypothetical protein
MAAPPGWSPQAGVDKALDPDSHTCHQKHLGHVIDPKVELWRF